MNIDSRNAVFEDCAFLAERLRPEDSIEATAQCGSPLKALEHSFNSSEFKITLLINDKPVAMFGLAVPVILGNVANIWLLGTPELAKIKKTFMVMSRIVVKRYLKMYPVLWAQVDARYTKTHKWLKWLGAEKISTYNLHGVKFNDFIIRRA
jgi:hypothetical protein